MEKDIKKISVVCPNPKCRHEFKTKSKLIYITCNSCLGKFHRNSNIKKKDVVQ